MTEIKRRKIEQALKNKGFERENSPKRQKHIWYHLIIDGRIEPRVRTHMSMGSHGASIRDKNLRLMSIEMKMNDLGQFFDFIDCTLTYEDYLEHLRKHNKI